MRQDSGEFYRLQNPRQRGRPPRSPFAQYKLDSGIPDFGSTATTGLVAGPISRVSDHLTSPQINIDTTPDHALDVPGAIR